MKDVVLSKLNDLSVEAYSIPVETDDTLVVLGRIKAATDPEFKNVESRLISFIEKALLAAEDPKFKDENNYVFDFPGSAAVSSLRYTWDFTFKGDLSLVESLLKEIKVPSLTVTRTEEVSTQTTKTTKGAVRPVRVGSL